MYEFLKHLVELFSEIIDGKGTNIGTDTGEVKSSFVSDIFVKFYLFCVWYIC